MNFNHFEFLLPVTIFLIIFIYFYNKVKNQFFLWIKDHWDFNVSEIFKFSEYLFLIGFIALGILFLDPRGDAKKVKADVQSQKTIIMIDTSSSMLVEDVRPNRLGKAVMLAKHYVKNAIGQQISVMVFSDSYKKIVPFTSDIDLLEARLNALETLRINGGGTSLKLSIQEALQYLKIDNKTEPSGNILVLTDAEENDLKGELEMSDGISLALVGIGTAKGGVIPIRDQKGIFKTNKKFNGELVVSKLNEKVLEEITGQISNSKYWIASNYSIPTNDILNFFANAKKEREKKGQVTIKPIVILPFFIIFFVAFILGSILKIRKPIITNIFLVLILGSNLSHAQEKNKMEEKPRNKDVIFLEQKLKDGELSVKEKKDLAYLYLRNNELENAEKLYSEVPIKEDEISVRFNKNKTLLQNKKIKEGLKGLKSLKDYLGEDAKYNDLKKTINSEILSHLARQKQDEKNSKDQKNKQEKSDDKKKSGSSGEGESKEEKDKKDQQEKDNKDDKNKDKNDDKKKDEGNKKNKDQKDKEQKQNEQKSARGKQRMKIKQLPALLKQLMSEDRKLQEKLLDTSTEERGNNNKKDW